MRRVKRDQRGSSDGDELRGNGRAGLVSGRRGGGERVGTYSCRYSPVSASIPAAGQAPSICGYTNTKKVSRTSISPVRYRTKADLVGGALLTL
jgi:hypothetical protein